ncbi:MAG: ABC transporter ATP-binding protein [Planctomycetota bacterium]|jgi:molybdopterin-binding protein
MLRVDGISHRLGDFSLGELSFTVEKGEYFVLLGESGAGKTVLLEVIAGLTQVDQGRVLYEGTDLAGTPIQDRDFGLVYQDHALFPHLTVRGNIGYALPRERRGDVEPLAERVGATHLLDRRPASLSLGEAQRVALARTLARGPRILMLDEPLASLDIRSRAEIRGLLRRIHYGGQTVIHVTHDYHEALSLATRVGVLEGGRLSQVGTPEEVFHRPRSRFVANFVGVRNFFHGVVVESDQGPRFDGGEIQLALPEAEVGTRGHVVFDGEDVTLSCNRPEGSAQNIFAGRIVDCEPVPAGIEVTVQAEAFEGVRFYAIITQASKERMGLNNGTPVWVSFKSTALRFIAEVGV